jgi:DNA-binding beta-propeller fold protein YncE
MQGPRRFVGLAAVGGTLAVVAVASATSVGNLAPAGCVADNDVGSPCALTMNGLHAARDVAVSSDGKSVYATSLLDDAVVRLIRNPTTGALTPAGCVDDNDTGADSCGQSTDGLGYAQGIAVSPDGRSVYATGSGDNAVVAFSRNTSTGELTPLGCVQDNDNGGDTCAESSDGLDGPNTVVVSPDGNQVYVGSTFDDAVVRLNRNTTTGELTPAGCIENTGGPDSCVSSMDGLGGVQTVAISADGKSLYATGSDLYDVAILNRNTTTGALSDGGCVEDDDASGPCSQSMKGLSFPIGVAVSADGKSVYATGAQDDAVARLNRDTTTGALTPAGCVDDNDTGADHCPQSTDGLQFANGVAVSPLNNAVYVAGSNDDAVVTLSRSKATGALTPVGCVDDTATGVDCPVSADGLDDPQSVTPSPDGSSVYTAAHGSSAVARFFAYPQTTIKGPTKTTDRTPKFKLKSTEPGSTFKCQLDDGNFKACETPFTTPRLSLGRHVLRAKATDQNGNADPTPARHKFKIKP